MAVNNMNGFVKLWYTQYKLIRKLPPPIRPFFNIFYRIYCVVIGVDIPYQVQIGEGLKISHPCGIVINENAVIGNNVWIRCNTVIGNDILSNKAPVIGDNVSIGANVCIIGSVKIGNNSIIGAGTVVVRDVPPFSVVVGNPGRGIKSVEHKNY